MVIARQGMEKIAFPILLKALKSGYRFYLKIFFPFL